MNNKEFAGKFWLPEEPDDHFEGVLKFNENGKPTLYTIYNVLFHSNNKKMSILPLIEKLDCIFGFVNEIGEVTLLNCHSQMLVGRGYGNAIVAESTILGTNIDHGKAKFNNISFGLTYLPKWIYTQSKIEERTFLDKEKKRVVKKEITVEPYMKTVNKINYFSLWH